MIHEEAIHLLGGLEKIRQKCEALRAIFGEDDWADLKLMFTPYIRRYEKRHAISTLTAGIRLAAETMTKTGDRHTAILMLCTAYEMHYGEQKAVKEPEQ